MTRSRKYTHTEEYLDAVRTLYEDGDWGVPTEAIATHMDVDKSIARKHCQRLVERDVLVKRWSLDNPKLRVYAPADAVED